MPEEVPAAAEFCGLSEADFREKYIAYHDMDGIQMASPRRALSGSCIFFKGGKCQIHPVKPFECRKVFGCEANRRHRKVREQMVKVIAAFQK